MAAPMTSRQRLKAVLARQIPDRIPLVDIAFWPETLERWHAEGLPADTTPDDYFGLDQIARFRFDGTLRLPEETVEETEEWRLYRDGNGVLIKEWRDWHVSYSPPARQDCLVKTPDAWRQVRDRLQVRADRIDDEQLRAYEESRRQDLFVVVCPVEPMWYVIQQLTGMDVGLPLLVEQPEMAADILDTYTDFVLGMCQLCVDRGLAFDGLWFSSDLCYRNGMFFSPRLYRELLLPCHRRIVEWCAQHDLPLIFHCDGDVRHFIPLLIEAGIDAIQPLEARCGNDVRQLKGEYGDDVVLFGNISTDVMAHGSDAELEEEVVTKIGTAKEGGGYIYHCDHSIPPTVSLSRYRRVLELAREHGAY